MRMAVLFAVVRFVLLLANNPGCHLNNDETGAWAVAERYCAGLGYTMADEVTGRVRETAWYNSFTVMLYVKLQEAGIPRSAWVLFINALTAVLHGCAIPAFHRLARAVLPGGRALLALWVFALYPSVLYYIGGLFLYENITLSVLLLVLADMLRNLDGERLPRWRLLLWIATVPCVLMLRPLSLGIFLAVFTVFAWLCAYKRDFRAALLPFSVLVLYALAHIPVLNKNERVFGERVVGTQAGFELLQGHNPAARGSWRGDWKVPGDPLYDFAHANIPGLDTLNELQESEARGDLAKRWMRENPGAEAGLALRKLAVYALPQNYEILPGNRWHNPVNALVHLISFLMMAVLLMKRSLRAADFLLLAPVAASLFITLLFFMGARWRYYAEPFLVIYAVRGFYWLLSLRRAA